MPTIPRGFQPGPPAPVYFNPGLSNAVQFGARNKIARDRNAIARERTGVMQDRTNMMRDNNALARQSAQDKIDQEQKLNTMIRQAQILSSFQPETIEEAQKAVGGQLNDFFSRAYGADPLKANSLADKVAGIKPEKPGVTWEEPYQDEYGNQLQKSSIGQVRKVTSPPKGMDIETTPEGTTVRTNVGRGGKSGISKGFQTDIEKRTEKLNDNYSQMNYIKSKLYDPKFTTLGTRWKELKTKYKAKTGWGDITSEDKTLVKEMSKWRRRTTLLFNEFVKLMSGVAVREEEMPRYQASIPTSGVGLFDGDDWITFEGKMEDFMLDAERAIARLNYVRKQGLTGIDEVNLDDVDKIITDRRDEIKTETPDISDDDLRQQLAEEFGIMF